MSNLIKISEIIIKNVTCKFFSSKNVLVKSRPIDYSRPFLIKNIQKKGID